jgi:protocatechuate 4,5-dioxygenase alpha chain
MSQQLDPDDPIENSYVFDGEMGAKGVRLNKLAESLNNADNRETFKGDTEAYMASYDLTEAERQLIRAQDWLNLVKAGGNIYNVIRIAAQFGTGLYPMGAQQLGLSYAEFLETRNVKGAT